MLDIRQVLNGATIRQIAGIKDTGEINLATVSNPEGGDVTEIADDLSDVYVHVQDAMTDTPIIGRLFSPGNMLWRLPRKDDSCLVLRGQDSAGPGVAYVMYGDGAASGSASVPDWLSDDKSGISVSENLRMESTGGDTEVIGNHVYLGDSSATEQIIMGTTYRLNESIMNTALASFFTLLSVDPLVTALLPTALPTILSISQAFTTFESTSIQYLSNKSFTK